jgi:hypothetical protein
MYDWRGRRGGLNAARQGGEMRSKFIIVAMLSALLLAPRAAFAETSLTVMSFNVWGGGANEQKPVDEQRRALGKRDNQPLSHRRRHAERSGRGDRRRRANGLRLQHPPR